MKYYRKMNPGNDVFKMLRCQSIVEALGDQQWYPCCCVDHLAFEGQEAQWIEAMEHLERRHTGLSDLMQMRREGVQTAVNTMKIGMAAPAGSPDRNLASEICHQLRIINEEFRDVVAVKVYHEMKKDYTLRNRYLPGWNTDREWEKLQENVSRNDAFESKSALLHRRFNGAHCSYFHRWFQHPVWRLSQARLGNGPYTLAGSYGEPATTNFQTVDSSFLPDRPSRQAYS
eukprot:6022150-Amphidinium_carterae.1